MYVEFFILLLSNFLLTSADVCIPTYHKTTYDLNALDKQLFAGGKTGYLRSMIIDEKYNRLIVGSRDILYFLNATSLKLLNKIDWSSTTDYERCIKNNDKNTCGNYIQFLHIDKNKLLICGSNSLTPKVRILSLNDTDKILSEKENFNGCASPYPDYPMVGSVTELGEIISAVYTDKTENETEIVGSYIMKRPSVFRASLTTSISQGKNEFVNPKFVNSIYVKDGVYTFFMEDGEELNNERVATVARMCQTDNGGPIYIEKKMWVTFRKARLNCKVMSEDKQDIFEYRYLASMTYDKENELFYGTYTMSKFGHFSSAVCTYTLKSIQDVFNTDFLSKDKTTGEWKRKNNGNFLNGCLVNRDKLNENVLKTSEGKEPTNSLTIESLKIALYERLMATRLNSEEILFQYSMAGVRFSKLTSEVIPTAIYGKIPVLYVATESGSVFILYKLPNQNVCKVDEIVTNLQRIEKLLLNKEKRLLYISSDEELISINVDGCTRYDTKSACINAHSPFCGWDTIENICVSTSLSTNATTLEQDLSKYPQKKDFWGAWSVWQPCLSGNSSRYCYCRQRLCESCDTSKCGEEESIQVHKCSESEVYDYKTWLLVGAVDGSWSTWGAWSNCNHGKCGNETMTRYRNCTSPRPNGGKVCPGDSFQCKSCAKKPEPCTLHWSEWSSWGECLEIKTEIYKQKRSRVCSRSTGCLGNSTEYQKCNPNDVTWGPWSLCSCQRVRHRLPTSIAGCGDDCKRLYLAEYEADCTPVIECPTTTPNPTTTVTTTESIQTTTPPRTTTPQPISKLISKSSTISETTMNNNVDDTTANRPTPQANELLKRNSNGIQLELRDLVIAICGIILTCFLVCTCIIVLVLKRKKGKFTMTNVEDIQSPQLIRNKSIGNDLDLIDEINSEDLKLTEFQDGNAPLMKYSTKV